MLINRQQLYSRYTYFYQNDTLYHNLCFLQTELLQPTETCGERCVTGPTQCTDTCSLEYEGQFNKSMVLTTINETHNISVWGQGPCTIRFRGVNEISR